MTHALPAPLYIDIESYSEIPITYGSHKYAEKAEILLFAYAYGDGPVVVLDFTVGDIPPPELYDPKIPIVMHNASFDRTIIRHVLKYDIAIGRVHCTLARARTLGLPGSLDQLCDILKVPKDKAKDKAGKDLIQLFCKPRPANNSLRRATRETHPKEWKQFIDYARLDIEAVRAIDSKCVSWNLRDRELALWQLDQKINDRGVRVDTDLATAALAAIRDTKRALDESTREATDGCVGSATQRDQLLGYILRAYGIDLPDMQASTLERRIEDADLPQSLRDLLALRLQTCTTSTAKYNTLLNSVSSDGRLRGILEFCGAGRTGRWAGRKFQPQNLPSRNLIPQVDIDRAIKLLKAGSIDLVYDNLMKVISSCIRGCIIASEGKKLVVSDLANIEGRVAAWLAQEEWKLQAFRDYDLGIGLDLYILAYARVFGIDPKDVTKSQRQIGKVMELMLQYEGGVGAFLTGAAGYNIDLDAMADAAWDSIPEDVLAEARKTWAQKKKDEKWTYVKPGTLTFDLPEKTYLVCDSLKRMWRRAHPAISSHWKELTEAIRKTFETPGYYIPCRKLKVRKAGSWLVIMLPSGRSMCYAAPHIDEKKLSYMGMNQYTRRWSKIETYGGKLFENACQAVARDVMAHNMPEIEGIGFDILFTCHDEVVTETDSPFLGVKHLSGVLAHPPPWGLDLPLAADGFESQRYRKNQ